MGNEPLRATGGEPKHEINSGMEEIDPEELEVQEKLAASQADARKLDFPTAVRSLVEYQNGFAVLSTNSKYNAGYPGGSMVGFAPDADGSAIFVFSKLSVHTRDVEADGRCSLTVLANDFKGAADGRVNLLGDCVRIQEDMIPAARETYLKKHPNAFWVTFGDFSWYKLEVKKINFVGGFARAGKVSGDAYRSAVPDPVSAYSSGVCSHMNDDHSSSTISIVKHATGVEVDSATMSSIDALGMDVVCGRKPKGSDREATFKIRINWSMEVKERKDVKDAIVQLSRAAAEAEKATAEKE